MSDGEEVQQPVNNLVIVTDFDQGSELDEGLAPSFEVEFLGVRRPSNDAVDSNLVNLPRSGIENVGSGRRSDTVVATSNDPPPYPDSSVNYPHFSFGRLGYDYRIRIFDPIP